MLLLRSAMITTQQFERGLRLDQYIASITQNKENFRANFIKATETFTAEDLAFFRNLPNKVNIAVVTEDANLDALRDVPIISRLSVEVGTLILRLFRSATHAEAAQAIIQDAAVATPQHGGGPLPLIAFYTLEMRLIGVHTCRVPELSKELHRRHLAWVQAHPEINDAREPLDKMTPITRTRLIQALYALTPEQRVTWGRKTVQAWRRTLQ